MWIESALGASHKRQSQRYANHLYYMQKEGNEQESLLTGSEIACSKHRLHTSVFLAAVSCGGCARRRTIMDLAKPRRTMKPTRFRKFRKVHRSFWPMQIRECRICPRWVTPYARTMASEIASDDIAKAVIWMAMSQLPGA